MSANLFELNADKTHFVWPRTKQQLAKVTCESVNLNEIDFQPSADITCHGVAFDSEMNSARHIRRLSGRCFYVLRQLRSIRRSLTADASKTLVFFYKRLSPAAWTTVKAFCLRLCRSLPASPEVLNAEAQLIMRKRKYDPVTATIPDQLHWLPVHERIEYNLEQLSTDA